MPIKQGKLLLSFDSDSDEMDWDFFCDELTTIMQKSSRHPYWHVRGTDLGWRRKDVSRDIKAHTGKELTDRTIPQAECSVRVHKFGKGFVLTNYHHDSPAGERYSVYPCSVRDVPLLFGESVAPKPRMKRIFICSECLQKKEIQNAN